MHDYNGRPRSAGVDSQTLRGRYNNYSIVGLREGVVTRVLYTDDPENQNKAAIEYIVRDLGTQKEFRCTQALPASGQDDGDDVVLRAAGKTNTGSALTSHTAAKDTDGDHVLFMCVEGSGDVANILGVKRHRQANYGAKRQDGRRRLIRNAGTNVELHADGAFTITRDRDKTRMTIDKDGNVDLHNAGAFTVTREGDSSQIKVDSNSVEVHHKSGARLTMSASGAVTLDSASGQLVQVQDGTLGIARLTDPVSANAAMIAWAAQVTAAIGLASTNFAALAAAFPLLTIKPINPVPTMPVTNAAISGASIKATSG